MEDFVKNLSISDLILITKYARKQEGYFDRRYEKLVEDHPDKEELKNITLKYSCLIDEAADEIERRINDAWEKSELNEAK